MIRYPTILTIRNVPTAVIDVIFYRGWKKCNKGSRAKHINRDARFLDFWILLKALNKAGTGSGTIRNYTEQLPELLRICKIKRSTFFTRKKWLIANNLMHESGGHLFLHSYKYLEPLYGIDTTERYKIPVYYDTTETNKQRLAELLYAEGEERKLELCKAAYNKKMDAAPDVRQAIINRAPKYGINPEELRNSETFRQFHLFLQELSYSQPGMEDIFHLTHNCCDANPDLNMTHAGIGRDNGFTIQVKKPTKKKKAKKQQTQSSDSADNKKKERKEKVRYSCSGAAHYERRIAKKGIIAVKEQQVIVSEWRARKDEKVFHASWVEERDGEKVQETIWFKPKEKTIIYKQAFQLKKTA